MPNLDVVLVESLTEQGQDVEALHRVGLSKVEADISAGQTWQRPGKIHGSSLSSIIPRSLAGSAEAAASFGGQGPNTGADSVEYTLSDSIFPLYLFNHCIYPSWEFSTNVLFGHCPMPLGFAFLRTTG